MNIQETYKIELSVFYLYLRVTDMMIK